MVPSSSSPSSTAGFRFVVYTTLLVSFGLAWKHPSTIPQVVPSHATSRKLFLASSSAAATTVVAAGGGCVVWRNIRGGDSSHSSNNISTPSSLEELEQLLQDNLDKLVVVDFYADDCPPCEKIAPLFIELSESDEFIDKVVFCKIHVNSQSDVASRYGVTGWPTFLFIKRGQVQTEIVGGRLAEATLYDWVRMLMPKHEETATTPQSPSENQSHNTDES